MKKILVLLLWVSFSFGHAEKYFQCSRYHKENWSKFGYEVGRTYKYNYTGLVRSSTFSKNEETRLLFTVEVDITSYSPFDYMMQLSNAKFEEFYVNRNTTIRHSPNENKHADHALSKQPLYFSFQNGRIDTICPDQEPRNILHVKKAILSAFQNSMPNFEKDAIVYESDINGVCETEYKIVDYNSSNFLLSKTKNLEACSHRKLHYLPWLSTSNYKSTTAKSASLLKSLHMCTQTFNKKFVLQSTHCSEEHLFQPFSNQGNGAVTRLSQSLVFVKTIQRNGNPPVPHNYKRESLLFDHKQDQQQKQNENPMVLKLLRILEQKTTNGIDQDVPKIFSHLVHEFQKLDSDGIYKVFESISNSPKKKKFLLDVLPLMTTVEGIITMKMLYQQGEISDSQVNSWLISLGFLKEVSLPMIGELTPLLRIEPTKQKSVLSITSLIYLYCKEDAQCLDKMEIKKVLKIIETPLLANCIPLSPENHNQILLSLKGIGNMGFSHSLNYLRTCYSNNDSPIELRLAAIAAHRRINCVDNDNLDQLENYFSNTRQNPEIRIAAYLAAMQCASYATFARVKDVLRRDETNQVGSFIWTHITNLQETSSKWKQNLKNLVGNDFLRNKFSTDVRKYSRNYEMSTFFDSINTGATIESNVIFTPDSYLPKSLMLNFTLDLFGETVNMFEVGARMEGYEEIIENLFGPEGYFPEESIQNVLEGFRNNQDESDKIQELHKSFTTKTIQKEPKGLLYAKIFGNEISYTQFKEFEAVLGTSINSRSILDSIMKFFRQQDIDYTKSVVFLDTSYRIPTVLGFPLELSVNGTATVGLTVAGKVAIKDMWVHKIGLEGKVYASTAIYIVGTMKVDSIVSRSGLRSVSSLNSNLYVDGHAFIDQGKLIDLKFNVPKKQVKIVNVESQVFVVQGENFYTVGDVSDDVENWQGCTQKEFNNITGFKLCSGLRYVNTSSFPNAPYFPLTGKFKFFVDAQKTDDFDNYQLNLKIHKEERNYRPVYSMLLYLDTPNSKLNRKIETSYHLDCEKLTFNTKLESPYVNWELDTKIGNEHDNLGFVIQTKSNNHEVLLAQLSLVSSINNNTWSYEPVAKFKYKNIQLAAISGKINYLRGQKYNANLVFDGFTQDPIEVLGDLHIGNKKFQLTGSIKSKEINGNTRATVVKKPGLISFVAKTSYDYKDFKEQVLDFSFKYHSLIKKTITEETLQVFLNSTQTPFYNTLLFVNIYRDKLYFESSGMLTLFQETWQTHQLFKFLKTDDRDDIALQCSLACVQKHIDYDINLSYIKSDQVFKIHGLAQLSKIKRIEGLLNYNATNNNKREFDFLLYFPKNEWTIKGVSARKTEEKYNFYFESFYEMNDTKEVILIVSGDYINSTLGNFKNHTVLADIHIPIQIGGSSTPWKLELSLQMAPDIFLSSSELRINKNVYKYRIAFAQSGFSGVLQIDDRELLVIHGAKEGEELTGFVSLNIYQHFEVSLSLLLPYQKLHITLFWDKDKDADKKISLLINTNVKKGLYVADLEYPRQKITTCFVLLPTEVTMNVTWGIDYFQRVYLKAGNKLYDIGGVWFAKLETPIKFMENQEFRLSYYLLPKNAEFKVDVSWQNHSVNFILSGMKSKSDMSGYLEVNTTLPQISKISVAVHHYRAVSNGMLKVKNDGTIVFNHHQITGQSLWQSEGLNYSTSFEIISSGIFAPIQGSLVVQKNDTTNIVNTFVKWKDKKASIDYKLENRECNIRVTTPFQGFEISDFKYIILGENDKLFLEMEVSIFKQYNYILLSWSREFDKTLTKISIVCPLINSYEVVLGHSTKYGHLNEYLIITQNSQNEIISSELRGDFMSILAMNLTATLKFLKQEASIIINNLETPINSLILVNWNEQYIKNVVSIMLSENKVVELDWNLSSTLLSENATCKYLQNVNTYLIMIELPRHLRFKNVFTLKDAYRSVDNDLIIETLSKNWSFHYFHTFSPNYLTLDTEVFFLANNNESRFLMQYNFDDDLPIVAHLQFTSPIHKPFVLTFSLAGNTNNTWTPHFYVDYNNERVVKIDSHAYLSLLGSCVSLKFSLNNYEPFVVEAKYDFSTNPNTAYFVLIKHNVTLHLNSELGSSNKRGYLTFNVTATEAAIHKKLFCSKFFYSLTGYTANGALELLIPEHKHNFRVIAWGSSDSNTHQANLSISSTVKNFEKVFGNLSISFDNVQGYFVMGVNDQNITTTYAISNESKNGTIFYGTKIIVQSTFDLVKNSSISAFYYENGSFRNLTVFGLVGNHNVTLLSNHNFNTEAKDGVQSSAIHSQLSAGYCNMVTNNTKPYSIKMQMSGRSETTNTGGKLLTDFFSNIPYFKKICGEAIYKSINYGHSVEGNLNYNEKHYQVYEELRWDKSSCVATARMRTPVLFGNVTGSFGFGDKKHMVTSLVLRNQSKWYNASFASEYKSLLDTKAKVYVSLPELKYEGKLANLITSCEANTEVVINVGKNKNNVNLKIKYPSWEKTEMILNASLPSTQYQTTNFHAFYNLNGISKTLSVQMRTNYGYFLDGVLNPKTLSLKYSTPSSINALVIFGKHRLNSVDDFFISYDAFLNKKMIQVNILHQSNQRIRTKIEVETPFENWKNISFLQTYMNESFEAKLYLNGQKGDIEFNKNALFNNQTLLLISYKDYLVNFWSGKENSHLTMDTPWAIYKIRANYLANTRQYGFGILENENFLLDVRTNIIERTHYLEFNTKTSNSFLPNYSEIMVSINYQLPIFSILVTDNNATVFSTVYQYEESKFLLNISSSLQELQNLQIFANVQDNLDVQVVKKQYNIEKTYGLVFGFLSDVPEAVLKIHVPWNDEQYLLDFALKEKLMALHLTTPYIKWKEVKFLAEFTKTIHLLSGQVQLHRNEERLSTEWMLEKNNKIFAFFDLKHMNFGKKRQHVFVNATNVNKKWHVALKMNNVEFETDSLNLNETFENTQNQVRFFTKVFISESMDQVSFQINNSIAFDLDHTQAQWPKLQLKYFNLTDFVMSYNRSNFDFKINSTLLNLKNAKFQSTWSLKPTNKELNIYFKNFGPVKTGKAVIYIKNKKFNFTVVLRNESIAFVNISTSTLIDNYLRGTAYVNLLDNKNFVNWTFNHNGFSELLVINSFLPYKMVIFRLSTTISSPSILLYVGANNPNLLEQMFGHSYMLLEYWQKDKTFSFKFDTPTNLQCSLLEIYGKLELDNKSIAFVKTLRIKSILTGYLSLNTNVGLSSSGARANIDYLLPFLVVSPEFHLKFHFPFDFTNNFSSELRISAPKGNYSMHGALKYFPNEFYISGGYQYLSQRSNVLVHVLNDNVVFLPKINLDWNIPYISYYPVKFTLKQKENMIDTHLSVFGVPTQLLLTLNNSLNNYSLNITLFSSNDKYNRLSAHLQYQNAQKVLLIAVLSCPYYRKDFGFTFDLLFDSLKKFQIDGLVSVPSILITRITFAHDLILLTDLKQYAFTSTVKINDLISDVKVKSSFGHQLLYIAVDAQINSAKFFTNLRCDGNIFDNINFVYELQTPIAALSDFKASLISSKNLLNGINGTISYNKKLLAHLDLYTMPHNFSINFYNVLLPLSIECKYLKSDIFELAGNICWDFNSPDDSQLGGHIYLGKNVSIGLITPTRVMGLDGHIFKDSQITYYYGRVSWFKNQEISGSLLFTNHVLATKIHEKSQIVFSFPFRTFEIIDEITTDVQYPRAFKSNVSLKWASSKASSMYFCNEILPGKIVSKLFVPIWQHEIILDVDLSWSKIPTYIKAQLMYSDDLDKHIYFEVFHDEDSVKTEKLFILQHPSSKVNYSVRFSTNRLPYASYGNLSLLYTNYLLNRPEEIKCFLKISHKTFEVYGELETNKNYASALASYTSGKYYQGFLTVLQINDKEPFVMEGSYNFKESGSSLSLTTSYGKERRYDLYTGFPSKRELTTQLSRTMYDKQVVDVFFSVKLNTSELLWIKLMWKNEVLCEYYNMIFSEYSDLRFIVESTVQELIDVVEDDVGQVLLVDFYNIRQNISSFLQEEIGSLSNDYLNFLDDLENGYQSNSFYYKYIQELLGTVFPQSLYLQELFIDPFYEFFKEVFDQFKLALKDVYSAVSGIYQMVQQQIEFCLNQVVRVKELKDQAKYMFKKVVEHARTSLREIEEALIDVVEEIDENITSIKQQCIEFFRPYLDIIESFIVYVEQRLALLQMLVLDVLDALQDYILNLRESREVIKMYAVYVNWLEEFHITDVLEPIADVIEQTLATILSDLKKVTDEYGPYIDAILGDYERISSLPTLVEFRKNFNAFSHKMVWIWNHHNFTGVIKSEIHQYVSNFDSYLVSIVKFNNSYSDFENIFQSSQYVFRPDIGIIEITQPLAVEWDAFDSLPHFYQHPLYDKIKEKTENLIKIQNSVIGTLKQPHVKSTSKRRQFNHLTHHFGDIINAFKSYIGETSDNLLSPPTNNIAMIIGNSHYITFDQKYFNFRRNCSYILTAEFVTKSFVVTVNHELPKRIIITTPQTTLTIFLNATVFQDNIKTSLPIINGSLTVIQEYHEIIVDYGKGVKVTCNLHFNYCIVQLSGWLFGKVGGLLGTLDNDMSTDLNLPDGTKASTLEQFTESWQVGTCQDNQLDSYKNETNISPLSVTLYEALCQLFYVNIHSPLVSCFSVIDPSPFYEICINDMKTIRNGTICSSIAAYIARCKYSSIDIKMPGICLHCNFNIGPTEEIFDKNTLKSIDVVIIKEINCFNSASQLTHFAKQLNGDLTKAGYTNNSFSVVGYGSDKPYIHLSQNKVWTQVEDLSPNLKLLPKVYFNADRSLSLSQTMNFVISNLEFRPGVTKQFLVFSCSAVEKSEDFKSLPFIFGEKDITMQFIKLNMNKQSTKNVLFMPNDVSVNDSIANKLNAVVNPQEETMDIGSLLAISTNGIAFHRNTKGKFVDNQILRILSEVISSTAKQSPCQKCKCVTSPDGTGKIECTRCMSPIVKQLLNAYESSE